MRTILQAFELGIDELRDFLSNADAESEMLLALGAGVGQLSQPQQAVYAKVQAARTNKKRYLYTVGIITLYGLLEQVVDALVEKYIAESARFAGSYANLPQSIRKAHILLSAELLKLVEQDQQPRTYLKSEDIVKNLHDCFATPNQFLVNTAAFVIHRGNLNLDKIGSCLSQVGIQHHLRRIAYSPEMALWFDQTQGLDIRQSGDQELLTHFGIIDDLVERRNDLSHGVIPADIDSTEILLDKAEFVRTYGRALRNVLQQELFPLQLSTPAAVALNKPIAVHNHTIVCFDLPAGKHVSLDDLLIVATNDAKEPYRFGAISSLQVNNQPLVTVQGQAQVGAQVPFRAKQAFDLFLLPKGSI